MGAGDGGRTRDLQFGKRQTHMSTRQEYKENQGFVIYATGQNRPLRTRSERLRLAVRLAVKHG